MRTVLRVRFGLRVSENYLSQFAGALMLRNAQLLHLDR